MNKRNNKLSIFFISCLAGLITFLPLYFFAYSVKKQVSREEQLLENNARELLLLEMDDLQTKLSPEKFIENALGDMNREFGLSSLDQGRRELLFEPDVDPKLITKEKFLQFRQYLEQKYKIQPLFLLGGSCDLKETFSYFDQESFVKNKALELFENCSLSYLAADQGNLTNILKSSPSIGKQRLNLLKANPGATLASLFHDSFHSLLSFYSNPAVFPGVCYRFYSSRFGVQHAYNYFYRVQKTFPNDQTGIYGLYYIGFKGSVLSPFAILREAIKQKNPSIIRGVVNQRLDRPKFLKTEKGIFYFSYLTSDFLQAIADRKMRSNSEKLNSLENKSLFVFIPTTHFSPSSKNFLSFLILLSRLSVLLIFTLGIYRSIRQESLPFSLSGKMKLAIALIIFIPIFGIFRTSLSLIENSKKEKIAQFSTKMNVGVRYIKALINEFQSRYTFQLLQNKKILCDSFQNPLVEIDSVKDKIAKNQNLGLINSATFFNFSGICRNFGKELGENGKRDLRFIQASMVKILSGMNLLPIETPSIKKVRKDLYLLDSLFGSYWKIFMRSKVFAAESVVVQDAFAPSPLPKAVFQFLAKSETPETPYAFVYTQCNEIGENRRLMDFLRKNLRKKSIYPDGIDFNINFGVFLRNLASLSTDSWPKNGTNFKDLRRVALVAFRSGGSGTEKTEEANNINLRQWVFIESNPLIIVAEGTTLKTIGTSIFLEVLPGFMLLYGILAVIFLSKLFSCFFLNPVQTLIAGVNKIENNILETTVEIKSGDEFEELGDSFNEMANGLLQRERMQRFVSDKLVESIASGRNINSEVLAFRINITILSSDIRDFTLLSEKHSPEEIVKLLNSYITLMEKVIKSENGSIEKLIGDAISAAFYPEDSQKASPEKRACRAALKMRKELAKFNAERRKEQLFTIENGIGIASGLALTGYLGQKSSRKDFVIISDANQTAENLESLTKLSTSKILIDENTRSTITGEFNLAKAATKNDSGIGWELFDEK